MVYGSVFRFISLDKPIFAESFFKIVPFYFTKFPLFVMNFKKNQP